MKIILSSCMSRPREVPLMGGWIKSKAGIGRPCKIIKTTCSHTMMNAKKDLWMRALRCICLPSKVNNRNGRRWIMNGPLPINQQSLQSCQQAFQKQQSKTFVESMQYCIADGGDIVDATIGLERLDIYDCCLFTSLKIGCERGESSARFAKHKCKSFFCEKFVSRERA